MDPRNLTLLTDLYEMTKMQGYFKEKDANETVIFDIFYQMCIRDRLNASNSSFCCHQAVP